MGTTAPAQAPTFRLKALSAHCAADDSAAIEDIPSSMQPPKETDHEHLSANPLQVQQLSRRELHLRLPAGRHGCGRASRCLQPPVRLRPAMPVRYPVPLRCRRPLRAALT